MTRLRWSNLADRTFETGLDRGVLYPKNAPAVAWNGLTGVDENGGDAATAYYIDGRPFLYFPTPKEFTANIKAYTYPDEFSELMGVAEAADGMYVDSQIGDSFDLSYRTLIGSGTKGPDADYKIHLIYNATVAPAAVSYASASDSVNATDFSWDIQAVPLPIPGYRPSAHVVIDTRHMSDDVLHHVEALLYGTGSSAATMPRPTELMDLLSYGDGIVITDLGDGTWTAEGSYHNVYMLAPATDGIFEIDNVDAVDHGDGTYSISSTP